jgi:hypothetical protein
MQNQLNNSHEKRISSNLAPALSLPERGTYIRSPVLKEDTTANSDDISDSIVLYCIVALIVGRVISRFIYVV